MGENLRPAKTISDILAEVSRTHDLPRKLSKLEFHVRTMEEELRKVEAFRRELPNCMILLQDAIERLKEEMLQCRRREMVMMGEGGDGRAKASNDIRETKRNWISSVQLWSTPVQYENNLFTRNQESVLHLKSRYEGEGSGSGSGSQFQQRSNFKHREGAFVPFKKPSGVLIEKERGYTALHGSSLLSNQVDHEIDSPVKGDYGYDRARLQEQDEQELQKKQRRCWSPQLHQRFIDALNELGGAQTATPKQIRELMKVEGLTNDEVKSHLQKYRIHVRKHPAGQSRLMDQPGDSSSPLLPVVAHCCSPQGPLHLRRAGEGVSGVGSSLDEEEDDKSKSRVWMCRVQKPADDPDV